MSFILIKNIRLDDMVNPILTYIRDLPVILMGSLCPTVIVMADGFRVALPILRGFCGFFGFVGWVERSETHPAFGYHLKPTNSYVRLAIALSGVKPRRASVFIKTEAID